MKRKVVKQGPSTLMVSLPSVWIKKYNIAKGELLDLQMKGSSLCITTDKDIDVEPVEFDSRGLTNGNIRRYMQEIYKGGHEEIKIIFDDPSIVPEIQNYISRVLIGYEIVDQKEHSIHVKSISKAIDQEFDQLLRRAFLVTKELGNNSLELIKKEEFSRLSELSILEETNDKLTNFCMRVLNKRGYKDPKKTTFLYCLIWQLEKVADEYNYIGLFLKDNPKTKVLKEVIDFYEQTNAFFNRFYTMFYSYDKAKMEEFIKESKRLFNLSAKLHTNKDIEETIVLNHLSNIINKTYNLVGPFIGTVV